VDFLAKSSPAWRQALGVGLTVAWPTGLAGNGNAGVSEYVKHTPGSLGYVEYTYALQNKLTFGAVENAYRIATTPTPETMQAAAGTVDWQQSKAFAATMTNIGGALAYPVTATSFILMPKAPKDRARSDATKAFFRWVFSNGDEAATKLNFVALPYKLVTQIESYWAKELPQARTSER
jgi:phosphate transport system substrate-binding protein